MTITISGTTGASLADTNSVATAAIQNAAITPAKMSGVQSGSAPVYGARAWCVFDGTLTGTNAPTAGGNVTSVTRNATGDYTINFTTALPDANYAVSGFAGKNTGTGRPYISQSSAGSTYTASSLRILTGDTTTQYDVPFISVAIFR